MAQSYGSKTVTTSATLIVPARNGRRNLIITNSDATNPIYIGPDASVTTANGIPIYAKNSLFRDKIEEGYSGAVYGIVAANSNDVRYWESYI